MPQHVRMNLHLEPGRYTGTLNHALEAAHREGRAALTKKCRLGGELLRGH
jgi:hypothetical protein